MKRILIFLFLFVITTNGYCADDPVYGSGTVTLEMDSNNDWTTSNGRITTVTDGEGAFILTPQNYTKYDDLEDTSFSNFYQDEFSMSRTASNNHIDDYSANVPSGSNGDAWILRAQFGANPAQMIISALFRPLHSLGASEKQFFGAHSKNKEPLDAYGNTAVGWSGDEQAANFAYKIAGGTTTSTGVSYTQAWHKFVIATHQSQSIERIYRYKYIYLDDTIVYSDESEGGVTANISNATQSNCSPTCCTITTSAEHFHQDGEVIQINGVGGMTELNGNNYTVDNPTTTAFELEGVDSSGYGAYTSGGTAEAYGLASTDFNVIAFAQYDTSGNQHQIDELFTSNSSNVYVEGTAESPKIQPSSVSSWDSHTVDEDTANSFWQGTTAYDIQWSSNGGVTWNGTWTTLNTANLEAISVDGDGEDALKVRITHTPDTTRKYNTFIPKTDQIVINYTAGTDPGAKLYNTDLYNVVIQE